MDGSNQRDLSSGRRALLTHFHAWRVFLARLVDAAWKWYASAGPSACFCRATWTPRGIGTLFLHVPHPPAFTNPPDFSWSPRVNP